MKKFERFIIYPLLLVALFYIISGQQIMLSAETILDKLVVRDISVVNGSGQEIVGIGQSPDGGGSIWTYNKEGVIETGMASTDEGGSIWIYNKKGVVEAGITSTAAGSSIWTCNKDGVIGATMMNINGVGGIVEILNKKGEKSVEIGHRVTGEGLISVYNEYGDKCTSYGYNP